jgi:hypothetical protein
MLRLFVAVGYNWSEGYHLINHKIETDFLV